jgi:hypothetical protein
MLSLRRGINACPFERRILSCSRIATGEVAFACVHQRLSWDRESTPFFVIAFVDGAVFFSRLLPPLFDSVRKRIREVIEITPGSTVRILYFQRGEQKWIEAVQLIHLEEEVPDFGPLEP